MWFSTKYKTDYSTDRILRTIADHFGKCLEIFKKLIPKVNAAQDDIEILYAQMEAFMNYHNLKFSHDLSTCHKRGNPKKKK